MRRRNPRFGCVRIAHQVSHVFGIVIDNDVVRRVLAKHFRPPAPMAVRSRNSIVLNSR